MADSVQWLNQSDYSICISILSRILLNTFSNLQPMLEKASINCHLYAMATFVATAHSIHSLLFDVAKYNLGEVRLELMQSAVFPFTVRHPRGGPLWSFAGLLCRVAFSLAVLFADLCGPTALDLQIFADSRPFPYPPPQLGCWCLGKYGSGKLFPLIIQCDGAC